MSTQAREELRDARGRWIADHPYATLAETHRVWS